MLRVPLLGFHNLVEAGLEPRATTRCKQGRVDTPIGIGRMVLQRVGIGADVGLVALIAPTPAPPIAEPRSAADRAARGRTAA